MILGYSIPPAVADELRALEGQLATQSATPAAAPFTTSRASCACGEVILLEGETTARDPLDDRFSHATAVCLLKDPDEHADEAEAWRDFLATIPADHGEAEGYLLDILTELPTALVLEAAEKAAQR